MTGLVESRMRGDVHVRFGGRPGETDLPKGRHRALGRPYRALLNRLDARSSVKRLSRVGTSKDDETMQQEAPPSDAGRGLLRLDD
jgi:hypothetical protein